jgi:hypothetical protein
MSQSLIKLVDNALLPAALMVLGKFLGIVLAIQFFGISWSVKDYANSIFEVGALVRQEDIATVTSYSDLLMYALLAIFFSWNIFRAIYFHNTHVKPTLVVKLANHNLLSLVKDSYQIYHSAAVWLLFTWISNVLIIINAFMGKTYTWIAVAATLFSILLTALLLQDVQREIENIKQHPGQYEWI